MIYKDWLGTWLELYVKPAVKILTYTKYETNIRVHIVPALGGYNLEQLTAQVLQGFVINLTYSLASNTVNGIITVLQKSLNTAVNTGITTVQYADRIVRPRRIEKKTDCFTISEQKKIEETIDKLNKPKYFGIKLSLYTGMRMGEVLSLQWRDVDLEERIISINKNCCYCKRYDGKYQCVTDAPKTSNSVRIIPLPKRLIPYMKKIRCKNKDVCVVNRNGKPITPRAYQYEFEKLLQRLGITHRGFHALRHTFATRAIECGMDVRTLSEILGHKNPTITIERYAHSLMEHKEAMINRVGDKLYK